MQLYDFLFSKWYAVSLSMSELYASIRVLILNKLFRIPIDLSTSFWFL